MVVSLCKDQIDHDRPWSTPLTYECSLEKLVDLFKVTQAATGRNRLTGSKFKTFAFWFSSTARVCLIKIHVSHFSVWTCIGHGRGYRSTTSCVSQRIARWVPRGWASLPSWLVAEAETAHLLLLMRWHTAPTCSWVLLAKTEEKGMAALWAHLFAQVTWVRHDGAEQAGCGPQLCHAVWEAEGPILPEGTD